MAEVNPNAHLAQDLLQQLSKQGVRDFLVCAGARNAPVVKALQNFKGVRAMHFFEERAAAFFALGRAKKTKRPVAVVTTSGTAAAELLPAMMEATYAGIPLVAVTADRPKTYRGSGAPQAVDQRGLYGRHAAGFYDWDVESSPAVTLYADRPVHVNISFDEPLLGTVSTLQQNTVEASQPLKTVPTCPLVIVSGLEPSEVPFVRRQLLRLGQPVYAEATSQLRDDPELGELLITAAEFSLQVRDVQTHFDGVIRVGTVPTLRLWRDLENGLRHWPVLSFSRLSYSGLSRVPSARPLQELEGFVVGSPNKNFLGVDRDRAAVFEKLLAQLPNSEPGYFRALSKLIPEGAHVFLGNSLPIRMWDLAAASILPAERKGFHIQANRGVNGIDGLVATFLGTADADKENWLILGDLSALYDLPSLALLPYAQTLNVRVVVVNNGGGMIFRRMFNDAAFENRHEFRFQNWARMFGWNYTQGLESSIYGPTVVEVTPDPRQTELFWKYFDELRA